MPDYDNDPARVQTRLQRMLATRRGQPVSGDGDATQVLRKVDQRHVRGAALTVVTNPRREGNPD